MSLVSISILGRFTSCLWRVTKEWWAMVVTDINIYRVEGERLKAYVSIIFNDCFIIRNLKIISGKRGLFLAMPNKKVKDGTYRDIAHPLNKEMRESLERAVIEKYLSEFPNI